MELNARKPEAKCGLKGQGTSQQQALVDFYGSCVCAMLHNPATAMHLMSDAYVADEYCMPCP